MSGKRHYTAIGTIEFVPLPNDPIKIAAYKRAIQIIADGILRLREQDRLAAEEAAKASRGTALENAGTGEEQK